MPTDTMPTSVYVGEGRVTVEERPVPVPGTGQVLIEVARCGICGTDLHLVLEQIARPGAVLGHEWAGTVAALGPDVTGWEVGDRIVANPKSGCGRCRSCLRGRPSVCLERPPPDYHSWRGAFSRYVTADAASLLRLPESLGTREAALTEPTAIAIHAVHLSGVTPEDRVLVTGAGPVGQLILAVLRAEGIDDVTVSEPSAVRRERAAAIGAKEVVAPEALPEAPMGLPVPSPFTVAFECSGQPAAAEAALDQLDYAGLLVYVGTGTRLPRVNHNRMIVLELTAIGAYNYDAGGFRPALELLASGRLPLDLLIEPDDIPLDSLQVTLERLGRGEIPGKVLVRPEVTP